MLISTSSYFSDFASSSLECTTWANVAVYGSVQIRSFRRVKNARVMVCLLMCYTLKMSNNMRLEILDVLEADNR